MASPTSGKGTSEYKKLSTRYDQIIEKLADEIRAEDLAIKLRRAKMITRGKQEEASVQAVANSLRIRPQIDAVLAKTELNAENYHTFIGILTDMEGLEEVIAFIDGRYTLFKYSVCCGYKYCYTTM